MNSMVPKFRSLSCVVLCLFCAAVPAYAQQADVPAMTLDQAVRQVHRETGGRILAAEQRRVGRRVEYRVKVLTPEGHVRVSVVSSDLAKSPDTAPSTKQSAGNGPSNKEKH
jgi:hypothetical protein